MTETATPKPQPEYLYANILDEPENESILPLDPWRVWPALRSALVINATLAAFIYAMWKAWRYVNALKGLEIGFAVAALVIVFALTRKDRP